MAAFLLLFISLHVVFSVIAAVDDFCTRNSCQQVVHEAAANTITFKEDKSFAVVSLPSVLKKTSFHKPSPSSSIVLSLNYPRYGSVSVRQDTIGRTSCHVVTWKSLSRDFDPHDCISLGNAYWYGGAELHFQRWPLNDTELRLQPFLSQDVVVKKESFGNVLEPFWINSEGLAVFVDESVPLHVSFNESNSQKLCMKAQFDNVYRPQDRELPSLKYTICKDRNIRSILQNLRPHIMTRPTDVPDLRMIKSPIWSTWAKYKVNINQEKILQYADEINKYGFSNSQLEIDDMYSTKYGDFDFDPEKFTDPLEMIKQLQEKGFRTTIWVTPFANLDSKAFLEGMDLGYWLKDISGNAPALVKWWQGFGGIIDPSNPNASQWYNNRLESMKRKYGVDSFKFDAGETTFMPTSFNSHQLITNPNTYATKYTEMVSYHGNMIEVRCGYRSQKHPIFVRMADKESRWGYDNGLKTIIPTALTFGILGYPFILPDMIGGNGYGEVLAKDVLLPDRELYIRWLQLTAYLPAMQFSFTPWDYDEEVIKIALEMVKIHEKVVTPLILSASAEAVRYGYPVIRPLWWVDPDDFQTYTLDSEFMVGNSLLVAPILEAGARHRDIYIPQGHWRDNLRGQTFVNVGTGGWIRNYKVDLNQIPTFELI